MARRVTEGDGKVTARTIRPWVWFAGAALAIALPQTASALVIVGGSGGPDVVVDSSAVGEADSSAFSFSELSAPPGPPIPDIAGTHRRIMLTPPGRSERVTLVPPRGVAAAFGARALLVPETLSQSIVLTPPEGAPIRLIRPGSKKLALAAPDKPRAANRAEPAKKAQVAKPAAPVEEPAKPALTPAPAVEKTPAEKPAPAQPAATAAPPAEPMPIIPAAPAEETKAAAPAAPTAEPAPPPAPVAMPAPAAPQPPAAPPAAAAAPAPLPPPTVVAAAPPAPAPIPAPPAAKPAATPSAPTIALLFDGGDARLNEAHRAMLKDIVTRLSEDPDDSVQLLAYAQADNRSKARRLSLSRALAVRSYLLSQDVRNTRIEVRALGDQVPEGKPDRVDVVLQRHP
ncbi:OmpA family protein [Oleispirillum naphthae]|uniref:OmpA family protein n=1 Tax=Oleispirillum naphthae TaxID=2838853 RepID=UPI0030823AAE